MVVAMLKATNQKNTACQSLATQEQAVCEITGGAICPSYEPILSQVFENARKTSANHEKPKIRNSFEFKSEHESKALSLMHQIYHRRKLLSTSVSYNIYNIKKYNIPTWENLNRVEKLFGICCFVVRPEEYMSFTLRFSKDFTKRALKSKKDLPHYISDRISQNFNNNVGFVPKFMFTVEKDKEVNCGFHIHGIIEASICSLQIFKHILKTTALGINYKQHPINRSVLRINSLPTPLGWLAYITKHKMEGYNMLYVNRSLSQQFKNFYSSIKYPN